MDTRTVPPPPTATEIRSCVLLFLLTLLSVFCVYLTGWTKAGMSLAAFTDAAAVGEAATFAGCLMGILLAHEMGHWIVARRHGFEQSLPIFLPVPFGFGTMGAVIRLRSMPSSRSALLEMGAAGPLAGAAVAIAVLFVALPLGREGVEIPTGAVITVFNDPLLVRLLGAITMGHAPGRYSEFHPAALAGWVGCLLTGVNLLPTGQLDGGHVLNALAPGLSRRFSRLLPVGLISAGLLLGAISLALLGAPIPAAISWLTWGAMIRFVGADRPIPLPPGPLSARAKAIACLIALLFLLTFMPVPMEIEIYGM